MNRYCRWNRFAGVVVALVSLSSAALRSAAADSSGSEAGAITGNGSAKLERPPELMRIQFEMTAEGKDVKEALVKLREKEKSTREKLAKLGASEKSIKVEESHLSMTNQEQQMMLNRMRGGRLSARPTTGPSMVQVAATVRAEWKLSAKSADDLLVEAQDLTTKIKSADLLSKQDAKKPATPEEQEAEEERALLAQSNGQPATDELAPQFVTPISEDERAKLMSEAFAKAKSDAAHLAKAAGVELGAIRQLTGASVGSLDASGQSNDYQARMYYARNGQMPQPDSDDTAEAIGMTPGKVTYRVMVTASFAVK